MKRIVLGLAALAATAATAAPASAHAWIETCYATIQVPCAVCYEEGPVAGCIPLR